jgi:hypothetical protein
MSVTNHEYQEFPHSSKHSPSLPWFVEYWASSIASKPIHEIICGAAPFNCTSESALQQNTMEENVQDVSSFSNRLRQVVASHEFDHDESETLWMGNSGSRYPTKSGYPSIRKSSILYEDDATEELTKHRDSILDKSMYQVDEDDDTRDGVPSASASSFMEDASSRILYTCESFDNFIRGKSHEESAVRLAPRMVGDDAVLNARPASSSVRRRLQPPPSPSATTYTTVSLTTSYMRDLDDSATLSDDEEDEDPKTVLERWTQASHELFRGMNDEVDEKNERDDIYSTPKQSRKRPSCSPPPHCKRKTVETPHQDKHEAYRYLIRMKPQNYVHDFSERSGWEEEKKEMDYSCRYADDKFDLPSHLQLQSDMTFHEAFFPTNSPPPSMPEF